MTAVSSRRTPVVHDGAGSTVSNLLRRGWSGLRDGGSRRSSRIMFMYNVNDNATLTGQSLTELRVVVTSDAWAGS